MVIDTSALIAILLGEREAPAMLDAIAADPVRLVASPTRHVAVNERDAAGIKYRIVPKTTLSRRTRTRRGSARRPLSRSPGTNESSER